MYPCFLIITLIIGKLFLWLRFNDRLVYISTGSFFVLALIFPISMIIQGYKQARDARKLRETDYWIHWQYKNNEWKRYLNSEIGQSYYSLKPFFTTFRNLRSGARVYWILFGFLFLAGYLNSDISGAFSLLFMYFLLIAIFFLITLIASSFVLRNLPDIHEVYIGPKGIYHQLRYFPFTDSRLVITSVEIIKGSLSLLQIQPGLKGAKNYSVNPVIFPIPDDHETEAQEIVERIRRELMSSKQ